LSIEKKTKAGMALAATKTASLDSIGFERDMSLWDDRFAQLETFKERHGHCRVNSNYDQETALGLAQWGSRQRRSLSKEKKTEAGMALAAVKIASLNSIGFDWDMSKDSRTKNANATDY